MEGKLKQFRNNGITLAYILCFMIWLVFWIPVFLDAWNTTDLSWVFYIGLIVPWLILLSFIILGAYGLNSKLSSEKEGKHLLQPMNIPGGLVRLFQLITVGTIFLYFLYQSSISEQLVEPVVPVGLLIMINAIVAYFGFKPREVLPDDYVVENLPQESPQNIQLINNLPVLRVFLTKFEEGINGTRELLQMGKETSDKITDDLTARIQEIEKIVTNIPSQTTSRDPFSIYNIYLFLIFIALSNLIAGNLFTNLGGLDILLFSGSGILIGYGARGKMSRIIAQNTKIHLEKLKTDLETIQQGITTNIDNIEAELTNLKKSLQEFKESNFLDFLPISISSILSIVFVSFLALYALITAQTSLDVPNTIFNSMQWFVMYYFTTKN